MSSAANHPDGVAAAEAIASAAAAAAAGVMKSSTLPVLLQVALEVCSELLRDCDGGEHTRRFGIISPNSCCLL
jgi:hypothetical protein